MLSWAGEPHPASRHPTRRRARPPGCGARRSSFCKMRATCVFTVCSLTTRRQSRPPGRGPASIWPPTTATRSLIPRAGRCRCRAAVSPPRPWSTTSISTASAEKRTSTWAIAGPAVRPNEVAEHVSCSSRDRKSRTRCLPRDLPHRRDLLARPRRGGPGQRRALRSRPAAPRFRIDASTISIGCSAGIGLFARRSAVATWTRQPGLALA